MADVGNYGLLPVGHQMFLPLNDGRGFERHCPIHPKWHIRKFPGSQFLWCLILGRDILGNKASKLCKIGTAADSEDIWIKRYLLLLLFYRFQPNFQTHLCFLKTQNISGLFHTWFWWNGKIGITINSRYHNMLHSVHSIGIDFIKSLVVPKIYYQTYPWALQTQSDILKKV